MAAEWIATIDGPAASGKSTVARRVAARLNASFLDTGATYRAATWAAMQANVDLQDGEAVLAVLQKASFTLTPAADGMAVAVDGRDVSTLIRDPDVTAQVHYLAREEAVRAFLVILQRDFAARYPRIVTEGRDQGTVVFPAARLKIFLTADPHERAQRRAAELTSQGVTCDVDQIAADIAARDRSDATRAVAPLKPASDAITVDTTGLGIDQVVDRITALAKAVP